MDVSGLGAVVTGGASGLGGATARMLAEKGARVAVFDLNKDLGEDVARVLADEPEGHRYLLPDVCLSGGLFLDGTSPGDLPRPVEIVATDGAALRAALAGATEMEMAR